MQLVVDDNDQCTNIYLFGRTLDANIVSGTVWMERWAHRRVSYRDRPGGRRQAADGCVRLEFHVFCHRGIVNSRRSAYRRGGWKMFVTVVSKAKTASEFANPGNIDSTYCCLIPDDFSGYIGRIGHSQAGPVPRSAVARRTWISLLKRPPEVGQHPVPPQN